MTDWAVVDEDPLGFLVGPQGSKSFLEEVWEQKPQVFKATPARKQLFNQLFAFKQLQSFAAAKEEEGDPLLFGVDINAARYVNGARETPNGDVADAGTIKDLFVREGCTMQVHQPQRFVDPLWRLVAAMERQLGCLVGCNAYLTPKHTQGLAPHHDDVEIFVIQTEGSKQWSIYQPQSPPGSHHTLLANHCSGDLEEGRLGQPLMEFILEVGDVLYMPRGTIHQARALSTHSSHLTISTYQRWAMGDLMQYTVSVGLASHQLQPQLPTSLRSGLPLGWVFDAASFSATDMPLAAKRKLAAEVAGAEQSGAENGGGPVSGRGKLLQQMAAAFRDMADWLEEGCSKSGGKEVKDAPLRQRALLAAGDALAEDFMRNRLPPHPEQLLERGQEPTSDEDRVACRGQGIFRLVPLAEDDTPEESEDEGEGDFSDSGEEEAEGAGEERGSKWVRLVSCLDNDRETHMMENGEESEEDEEECCGGPGCHYRHHHHDEEGHEHENGCSSSDEDADRGNYSSGFEGKEAGKQKGGARQVAGSGKAGRGPAAQKRKQQEESGDDDDEAGEGRASPFQRELDALKGAARCGYLHLDALRVAAREGYYGDGEFDVVRAAAREGFEEEKEEEKPSEDIVFPMHFVPGLLQLLGARAEHGGVRVDHLSLPSSERQGVVRVLWEAGVLATLPREAKEKQEGKAKKAKADGLPLRPTSARRLSN